MENANLSRTLKNAFYSLSRKYGTQATIFRLDSNDTDLVTGKKTKAVSSAPIRNCVQIPVQMQRSVLYTASMMQSLRPFAWQGGAGQDVESTMFMVLKTDLRDWGEITPYQWINFRGGNYQVVEVSTMDGGWVFTAKRTRGTDSGISVIIGDVTGLIDNAGKTIVPTILAGLIGFQVAGGGQLLFGV